MNFMPITYSLLFIGGILVSAAVFYLILFFGFGRRKALLFLSICCLCQAIKALFREDSGLAQEILQLSAEQSHGLLIFFYSLGSFSLLAFLVLQLKIARPNWWLAGIIATIALAYFSSLSMLPSMLAIGLIISIIAYPKDKVTASVSILGLVCFGTATYLEVTGKSPTGYFIGIILFMIFIALLVGYEIQQQIRNKREMLTRSTRLENQLLKKSLQPHFLFNSLMSLQEWIERSPEKAANFVQDLASEFRLVSKLSGEKLIPIHEELEMCRAHLAIMGYRKNASFSLVTEGIIGDEKVPPAIFHTLIENGITHGFARKRQGIFRLTKIENDSKTQFTLEDNGESITSKSSNGVGTGYKYVKSRLEESYPGSWTLTKKQMSEGWSVAIEILKK